MRRVVYTEPEDLSPLVSDLYRWWYAKRGIDPARLLVEQFIVMEPWWTLRTGSVPLWLEFNTERSLRTAKRYLEHAPPYRDIRLMMFNHGVGGVGVPSAEEWASIFERVIHHSGWVGTEPGEFPTDYAQFSRYHEEVQKIPERRLMPHPLSEGRLDEFIAKVGDRYDVSWKEDDVRG